MHLWEFWFFLQVCYLCCFLLPHPTLFWKSPNRHSLPEIHPIRPSVRLYHHSATSMSDVLLGKVYLFCCAGMVVWSPSVGLGRYNFSWIIDPTQQLNDSTTQRNQVVPSKMKLDDLIRASLMVMAVARANEQQSVIRWNTSNTSHVFIFWNLHQVLKFCE